MHLAEAGGTLQTAVRDRAGECTNLVRAEGWKKCGEKLSEGWGGWGGGEKQSKTEQLPGRELVTRLHAWVPLSIKVSEAGRSSSAEGDVRASLAPFSHAGSGGIPQISLLLRLPGGAAVQRTASQCVLLFCSVVCQRWTCFSSLHSF